jgi:hypothetical protein
MKKLILIGITAGIASLAQANSVTLDSGTALNGTYAYLYNVNSISLPSGYSISDATLSFNSITLTSTATGVISSDLINLNNVSAQKTDNDASGDYFQSNTPNSKFYSLGTKSLTKNNTQSWSYVFTDTELGLLNNDVTSLGGFDIGIDPDCNFSVGSIVFSYDIIKKNTSVPDQAMTAGLLGMSFLGLLAFRRKLAFN